ncbi:prolyl oligopeptidase family serine peptidase [Lipingzhangella sp. LS1_29]|uniref:Prolyl oligopeptidase family serine peptidase n=1 Tax=Lipingzhangella rawalii TaxID=2055835 RepID=A0ABU2H8P7_9ACTN|nr:prolyl oligopeptidase family serine peptidase [Lipingzhangella rawalii]MDS1271677.1 prolyl oligopeptidase family serine peptidase [Lipingzhangella rawalii]
MTDPATACLGAWPSPITARDAARGDTLPAFPTVVGTQIWWQESLPEAAGRVTVLRSVDGGSPTDLLAEPWSARTRVHEYGGRSYLPVPTESGYGIVFSEFSDQRLYLLDDGATLPTPLTPEPATPAGDRYADLALTADQRHVVCVLEHHASPVDRCDAMSVPDANTDSTPEAAAQTEPAEPAAEADAPDTATGATESSESGTSATVAPQGNTVRRSLVRVPLDGSAAEDPTAIVELLADAEFYASPVPSPDGVHLAWIAWNHPRMPWDSTELRIARFTEDGTLDNVRTLKGGPTESVLAPRWRDEATLFCVSDWSGWWNLYEIGLHGPAIALCPMQEEFSPTPLLLGTEPYCAVDDRRIIALHGDCDLRASRLDTASGEITELDSAWTWQAVTCDTTENTGTVVGIAASPTTPAVPVSLDIDTGEVTPLRKPSLGTGVTTAHLPTPRRETVTGRYGEQVHATVYPPRHPEHTASGPAPFVVWIHGGPTACSSRALRLELAYFTSRGFGVVDVNYGGSTGFGRSYRERLHNAWGVVDVDDAVAVARSLVADGTADPRRLAIRGGSAGGLTTLLALTRDTFACGVSRYGVTDLLRLAEHTHDFESRYLDALVGPLPGYQATYAERSPVNRVDDVNAPVLLLQGTEDPVVPLDQATAMAERLAERAVPHALYTFEGEGHGFRDAENRARALEAELAFYAAVFDVNPPDVAPLELRGSPASPANGAGEDHEGREGASPLERT